MLYYLGSRVHLLYAGEVPGMSVVVMAWITYEARTQSRQKFMVKWLSQYFTFHCNVHMSLPIYC